MNFAFTDLFINDCHDDLEDDDNNISCECLDAMEDANPGVVTDMDCTWDITHHKTVAEQYEDECPQINWALIIGLIIGGIIFLGIIIGKNSFLIFPFSIYTRYEVGFVIGIVVHAVTLHHSRRSLCKQKI